MKKQISSALLLIFGATIVFPQESKIDIDKKKLTIKEIKKDLYSNYVAVTGTVVPVQTIYLVSVEKDAIVADILVEEGIMVKKGELIVKLKNQELALEISNHEARIYDLSNELKRAKLLLKQQALKSGSKRLELQADIMQQEREFRRNQNLHKEGNVTTEEYEFSKKQYELSLKQLGILKEIMINDSLMQIIQIESLENSLMMMQDKIQLLNKRVEELHYRAPESGELINLDLQVGQVLKKGQRMGQINILDSYKLKVDIDEYFMADVLKGLTGESDFSGTSHQVIISKIYPEVTQGRFTVDMDFVEKAPEQLMIGQTVRISLELGNPRNAILLPRGGFYQSTGGQWVFVVDPSGKFAEKRIIKIGSQNPGYYEVLDGLEPGEQVVISNYNSFGDTDKLIFR